MLRPLRYPIGPVADSLPLTRFARRKIESALRGGDRKNERPKGVDDGKNRNNEDLTLFPVLPANQKKQRVSRQDETQNSKTNHTQKKKAGPSTL